tara:strand:+ start:82 stop:357 length:276 start_codon:yes stop_codon:yes gene_type:complete
MTLTKKNISKKIKDDSKITHLEASRFLNSFLDLIKFKSKKYDIKIHNFGSFIYKFTPKRLGRNPKTGKTHTIKPFNRLIFKASIRLKNYLN